MKKYNSRSVGRKLMIGCIMLLLFWGCNLATPGDDMMAGASIPTINPLFNQQLESTAEVASAVNKNLQEDSEMEEGSDGQTIVTRRPTATATATPIPTAIPTPTSVPPITIFDETLHPDWTLEFSSMRYNDAYADEAYRGKYSLALIPTTDFRQLFFTVKDDVTAPYYKDEIVGVTFRLFSGSEGMTIEDLIMTVVGSNDVPYWQPGDESVTNIYEPIFSETNLLYLGITNNIPPNTWVWVTNWFDDREFDPNYKYITGFYIKNDEEFDRTVLIDEVNFIPLGEDRRDP